METLPTAFLSVTVAITLLTNRCYTKTFDEAFDDFKNKQKMYEVMCFDM